jgi:hypothetical protein
MRSASIAEICSSRISLNRLGQNEFAILHHHRRTSGSLQNSSGHSSAKGAQAGMRCVFVDAFERAQGEGERSTSSISRRRVLTPGRAAAVPDGIKLLIEA